MGLINLDKRTKQGRKNRETLMILKVVYWIVSKILKVFYWIVVGPFILFWRETGVNLHQSRFFFQTDRPEFRIGTP